MLIRRPKAATANGQLKVKASSQKLVAANESRAEVIISNLGEKNVYLGYGVTAVKEKGTTVFAGTSLIEEHFLGEITAISHEGEFNVTFTEV